MFTLNLKVYIEAYLSRCVYSRVTLKALMPEQSILQNIPCTSTIHNELYYIAMHFTNIRVRLLSIAFVPALQASSAYIHIYNTRYYNIHVGTIIERERTYEPTKICMSRECETERERERGCVGTPQCATRV